MQPGPEPGEISCKLAVKIYKQSTISATNFQL